MADWSDATDEWLFKLTTLPTFEENVISPTRVLQRSTSNLLTSCLRNDFTFAKLLAQILPDSSIAKMTSTVQSNGVGGRTATAFNVNNLFQPSSSDTYGFIFCYSAIVLDSGLRNSYCLSNAMHETARG